MAKLNPLWIVAHRPEQYVTANCSQKVEVTKYLYWLLALMKPDLPGYLINRILKDCYWVFGKNGRTLVPSWSQLSCTDFGTLTLVTVWHARQKRNRNSDRCTLKCLLLLRKRYPFNRLPNDMFNLILLQCFQLKWTKKSKKK